MSTGPETREICIALRSGQDSAPRSGCGLAERSSKGFMLASAWEGKGNSEKVTGVGCRCRLRPAPGTRVPPGPRSACAGRRRRDVAPIDAAKAGQNLFRLRRQPSKSHRLSMIHTAVLEILIRRSRRARARPRARGRESASYCKTYGSCAARAWPANRMHSATRGRREHHASELSPSPTAPRRALRRGVLVHTSRFDPRTEAAGLTPCLYRDGIAEATR